MGGRISETTLNAEPALSSETAILLLPTIYSRGALRLQECPDIGFHDIFMLDTGVLRIDPAPGKYRI
jgi:hypothetical protein